MRTVLALVSVQVYMSMNTDLEKPRDIHCAGDTKLRFPKMLGIEDIQVPNSP